MKQVSTLLSTIVILLIMLILHTSNASAKLYMGKITMQVGETRTVEAVPPISAYTASGSFSKSGTGFWISANGSYTCRITATYVGTGTLSYWGSVARANTWTTDIYDMYWDVEVKSASTKVTSVSLNSSSISLQVGETKQLSATVSPSNATDKSVSWSSGSTSIATVSSSGLVTAKSAGSVYIFCNANDGSGKQATCLVTVSAPNPIKVTSISLNYTSTSMYIGDTKQLSATVSPSNATDKTVSWSSSNSSIATVDNTGKVTAKARGTATITCKANDDSGKQGTCVVTVNSTTSSYFTEKTVEGVDIKYYVADTGTGTCKVYGTSSPSEEQKAATKVTIPEKVNGMIVDEINSHAFHGWKSLTTVNLPTTIKRIGQQAFYNCMSLSTITGISDGVEYIGLSAFSGPSTGTHIPWYDNLPKGLLYLGKVLYSYKGTMPENTTLDVKYGTTQIGVDAFDGQDGLVAINIPQSVVSIGRLGECNNLKTIKVAPLNSVFDSRNNCNAIIETATNTLIAGCGNTVIPTTVKKIGSYAMYKMPITSLVIPDNIESIADGAFCECGKLESVIIGKGLKSIDTDRVFYGCYALSSIFVLPSNPYFDSRDNCNAIIRSESNKLIVGCQTTIIPQTVKKIGEYAFWTSNEKLLSLVIPDAVEEIDKETFRNLYKLQSIVFGKGIKKVGSHLLIWCYDLKDIYMMSDIPFEIEENTFDSDYSSGTRYYDEVTLHVPAGAKTNYLTSIGWYKFKNIVEFDPISFDPTISNVENVSVDTNSVNSLIYNLSGQRLDKPRKGINIIGGKKVMVK